MIIDATNMILGRLATKVAKLALLGNEIVIINCEKAVISGKKKSIFKNYNIRKQRGIHTKGPFLPRMPDRFVKRTIRGMLPYKKPRGRDAFKRIKCFSGVPAEFNDKEKITFNELHYDKLPNLKFVTVKEVCKNLGAKNET